MDSLSNLLIACLFCIITGISLSYLVFIWFQTTFLVEYAELFRLGQLVKADEWNEYKEKTVNAKYPYFLRETYKNWFTKLTGCPFCIIGFTSIPLSFFIAWWASGPIAFIAAAGFLLMELLYKNIYS